MDPTLVGRVIDGRYRVQSILGAGGSGTVYKALQCDIDRVVAIKTLHTDCFVSQSELARFQQEAKVLSQLCQENIVRVFAAVIADDMSPALVMEYVEGTPLSNIIQSEGRLSESRILKIGLQAAKALEAAHAQNIVHRDLKPQNIMISNTAPDELVKIIDFGLARWLTPASPSNGRTRTGTLIGTPQYMSPEQCSGLPADARSDIYSLGCVLYECAAGVPAFSSDNAISLLYMHRNLWPERLSSMAGTFISKELEEIIFKCIQKNRDDRFLSATELKSALELLLSDRAEEINIGRVCYGEAKASKVKVISLCVILSLLLLCAFISIMQLRKSSIPIARKSIKQNIKGSPERRLYELCERPDIANNKKIEELEKLIPELKGNASMLRLAYAWKGYVENILLRSEQAKKSLFAALSTLPADQQFDNFEARQIRLALTQVELDLGETENAEKDALALFDSIERKPELQIDDSARSGIFRSIETCPKARLHSVLARVFFKKHMYSDAAEQAKKSIAAFKEGSHSPPGKQEIVLADSYQGQGKHKLAVQELENFADHGLSENKPMEPHSFTGNKWSDGKLWQEHNSTDREREYVRTGIIPNLSLVADWFFCNQETKRGLEISKRICSICEKTGLVNESFYKIAKANIERNKRLGN